MSVTIKANIISGNTVKANLESGGNIRVNAVTGSVKSTTQPDIVIKASIKDQGPIGPTGPVNTLEIGTVESGDTANATITGTSPNQTLNLIIPKGDKGDAGDKGDPGTGITEQSVGFTITGGTTPKTLTVALDADVSGTNTGDNSVNTTSNSYADGKIAKTTNITALNDTGIADGEIAVFNLTNKDIRTSDKTIVTSLGADDTTVPTSKAVKDVTDAKIPNALVDAKGDLITASADNTPARLAVGSDGYVLESRASETTGLRWVAPSSGGSTNLFQQALINGNFDVWQRGTSLVLSAGTFQFLADRFSDYHSADGGTLPTLTRSRQAEADENSSYYYSRLTTNGAGTSLGNNSVGQYLYKTEHGTRFLCGTDKKVTLSFYARSSIANKKLGIRAIQTYGSGGSPSSDEIINGTNWTLTSSWVKYTHTFTTNTLSGKTFGTANDDSFQLLFAYMWGSTRQAQYGASTAETYVGSGDTDIKKVQLCAGDVALPFMPKSFEEELRACQRYFQIVDNTDSAYSPLGMGYFDTTTTLKAFIPLKVTMRVAPTLDIAAANTFICGNGGVPSAVVADRVSRNYATVSATVSAVTVNTAANLIGNNTAAAYVKFSAEL